PDWPVAGSWRRDSPPRTAHRPMWPPCRPGRSGTAPAVHLRGRAPAAASRRQGGGGQPSVAWLFTVSAYPHSPATGPSTCEKDPTRRVRHGSEVHLTRVDRVGTRDPVQEEQAGAVVDLMLERPRLERVGGHRHRLLGPGQVSAHHHPPGAFHVAGEVRYGHTPLPARAPPAALRHLGVAEYECAVAGDRLGVG